MLSLVQGQGDAVVAAKRHVTRGELYDLVASAFKRADGNGVSFINSESDLYYDGARIPAKASIHFVPDASSTAGKKRRADRATIFLEDGNGSSITIRGAGIRTNIYKERSGAYEVSVRRTPRSNVIGRML